MDYDLEAMRQAVRQCDKNVEVFEEAIRKEKLTKEEYQHIIRTLEKQAVEGKLLPKVIKIDASKV